MVLPVASLIQGSTAGILGGVKCRNPKLAKLATSLRNYRNSERGKEPLKKMPQEDFERDFTLGT
jgi:hypothetical protein